MKVGPPFGRAEVEYSRSTVSLGTGALTKSLNKAKNPVFVRVRESSKLMVMINDRGSGNL